MLPIIDTCELIPSVLNILDRLVGKILTDGWRSYTVVKKTVSVHMEDVAHAPIGHGIPDNIVAETHLECRVVCKDVPVHGVE
jgi:hypothetical protein